MGCTRRAEGLAQQDRGDRGIHASREGADHGAGRSLPADRIHLLLPEPRHRPVGLHLADAEQEVLEDLGPVGRMTDLRMELDRPHAAPRVLEAREGRRRGRGNHAESLRRRNHRVPVVHPDGLLRSQAVEELRVDGQRRDGAAVLAPLVGDLAACRLREPLHAVAETEHRNAEGRRISRRTGGALLVHALRPAGEDDPRRVVPADLLGRRAGREHDREDARVAHAARDQLRVLATEIEDDDRACRTGHATPAFASRATGPARTAAGSSASAAAANGAAAARSGATSAPGACRRAARSATHITTTVASRKTTG